MSNGSAIASQVLAGLAEAGVAAGSGPLIGIIRRKGAMTGPEYAPEYGPDTLHKFTVILSGFSATERADTAIMMSDTKIICSVGDITPSTADIILVRGVEYAIKGVDSVAPGGVDLLYKIWARS